MASVIERLCTGCGACLSVCPMDAIELDNVTARIDPEKCTDCGACLAVCPNDAIVLPPAKTAPVGAEHVIEIVQQPTAPMVRAQSGLVAWGRRLSPLVAAAVWEFGRDVVSSLLDIASRRSQSLQEGGSEQVQSASTAHRHRARRGHNND